jgi:hypothetical protein
MDFNLTEEQLMIQQALEILLKQRPGNERDEFSGNFQPSKLRNG